MDEQEEITKPEHEPEEQTNEVSQTPAQADGVSPVVDNTENVSEPEAQSQNKEESAKVEEPKKAEEPKKPEQSENNVPETKEKKSAQSDKAAKEEKPSDKKDKKASKEDKKKKAEEKKSDAKMKKEWEDSIVANKRVKREEVRRKVKQATVILLIFALVVTSVVYVMLLFMQENNVRITASSKTQDTSISLSMDNNMWTPYLNANGPESIWDISYNPIYNREKLDTIDEVKEKLGASDVQIGDMNGEKFIRFVFMVKNTGKYDANVSYEMTLEYDRRGLQNAVRVMWGESFKSDDLNNSEVSVDVYAARSNNPRLKDTGANYGVSEEDGYIEYIAYPWGSDKADFDLLDYESTFTNPSVYEEARKSGYVATTPFLSNNYVFQRHATLAQGDIMYCYVCIWVEGSDFDCVDDALGGYVKLGINFVAY